MTNLIEVNDKIRDILNTISLVKTVIYGEVNEVNVSKSFKPIEVVFKNLGVSGANSEQTTYDYSISFFDKVREDNRDLEQVQSKMVSVLIELVSKLNRDESKKYQVVSDASNYGITGNDKLHGYELIISIAVFNPEQIC